MFSSSIIYQKRKDVNGFTEENGKKGKPMITKHMMEFLEENYWQNSREWYQAHKEEYRKHVLTPLVALVEELTPFMRSVDPLIVCEPKVDRTISRIYRDLRYARYDTLYRNEVWLSFRRDNKEFPLYPQFYVYFTPLEYGYGCGYYIASPEVVRSIRSLILERSPRFTKMVSKLAKQDQFVLQGQAYKRDRFPDAPAEYKDWLNRKNFFMEYTDKALEKVYSEDFSAQVTRDFEKLVPFYQFLLYAEEKKEL